MKKGVVYKFINIFEKDGITPKANTDRMNYDEIRGKICEEISAVEIDYAMLLKIEGLEDGFLRTSNVTRIERFDSKLVVYTKNTIYELELINTYED